MKVIEIENCKECPYFEEAPDKGQGHQRIECSKYYIVFVRNPWHEVFPYEKEIHPNCQLDDK